MSGDSVNQGSTVVTLVPEVCMNNRNFSEREIFIFKKQNFFLAEIIVLRLRREDSMPLEMR